MKQITVAAAVLAVLGGSAGFAVAEPPRFVFHEEAGRSWTDLAERFKGLGAQLERHFRGGPGGMGPMWGSPAERPLISFMLEHRDDLGLTPDQVNRLETLRSDFAREAVRREADIRVAEMDLQALLEHDPVDLPKVEAKIREVAQLRADLRVARLRTIEQGKAVLTAEQRSRLQGLLGGPRGPRRTVERQIRL